MTKIRMPRVAAIVLATALLGSASLFGAGCNGKDAEDAEATTGGTAGAATAGASNATPPPPPAGGAAPAAAPVPNNMSGPAELKKP